MKLIVNPHKIELIKEEAVNEKEINISNCTFEFSEEYGENLVKEAYFTLDGETYKQIIVNNECSYPPEVLVKTGTVELGVVAYEIAGSEYIERFNPSPVYFQTTIGSLKEHAENSQEITPSEMEQFEQALEEGLAEVQNVNIDATKVDNTATVSITNRNGETKTVEIYDGEKGEDGEPGITPNIQVGNTTTLPAGSNATVSQRGTQENPIFDFGIPKGKDGEGKVTSVNGQIGDVVINIPDTSGLGASIELSINSSTYVMTLNLKNENGTVLSTGTVDLPLESVVVNGTYDNTNKKIILTLQNGNTIDVPVGDLVSGLQETLVSGTNIKTINNQSILGSGNIDIEVDDDILILQYNDNSDKAKAKAGKAINNHYGKSILGCIANTRPVLLKCTVSQQQSFYKFIFQGILDYANRTFYVFTINGTWTDNVFTCTSISYDMEYNPGIFAYALSTKNTEEFTPTADSYKPATAKYAEQMVQSVAPAYSSSSTYAVGDFVSYQGKLYKCSTAIGTAESWTAAHWTETTATAEMGGGSTPTNYIICGDYLIYTLSVGNYKVTPSSSSWISNTNLPTTELADAMSLAYANSKKLILNIYTTNSTECVSYFFSSLINTTSTTYGGSAHVISTDGNICNVVLNITYSYSNGVFYVSGTNVRAIEQLSLGTANTYAYTPTQATHPATKGYVDGLVGDISTILETLVTVEESE